MLESKCSSGQSASKFCVVFFFPQEQDNSPDENSLIFFLNLMGNLVNLPFLYSCHPPGVCYCCNLGSAYNLLTHIILLKGVTSKLLCIDHTGHVNTITV